MEKMKEEEIKNGNLKKIMKGKMCRGKLEGRCYFIYLFSNFNLNGKGNEKGMRKGRG